jgi:hypothetical protein
MVFGSILSVGLFLALPAPSPAPQQSACSQALAGALTDGAASEMCAGDEAARLANAAPRDVNFTLPPTPAPTPQRR